MKEIPTLAEELREAREKNVFGTKMRSVIYEANEEGITPLEAVEKYHEEFKKCFKSLGFSFDIFAITHSEYHEEKVKYFILELYKKGFIYEKNVEQTYCENVMNI